ncbi:TPA: hypothetical protein HNN97_05755 [Escherichia coli]|nr:hypothetical protein [Escherichia coli]
MEPLNILLGRISEHKLNSKILLFIIRAALAYARGKNCPIPLNYYNLMILKSIQVNGVQR